MRDTLYLDSDSYQKQTFLLQVELLAKLETQAKQHNQTVSAYLNTILNKELANVV